jgi:hypothetical protein
MRREHDDQSSDAWDDGAGERHRRSGNTGRIASRLLKRDQFPRIVVSPLLAHDLSENRYRLFRIMLKAENPLPNAHP